MDKPSPNQVGREFVRQYYTLLNKAPALLHRFYSNNSSYLHGGKYCNGEPEVPVIGQNDIHRKIESLDFNDCHTKIKQVDAHSTIGSGVVVQVTGELSNAGQPLRRFMQTFVLAPQGENPFKFYVHNDIFRYQDDVFNDELQVEHSDDDEQDEEYDEEELQRNSPPSLATMSHYHEQPPLLNNDVRPLQADAQISNGMEQLVDSISLDEEKPHEAVITQQSPRVSTPEIVQENQTREEAKGIVEDRTENVEPHLHDSKAPETTVPSKPLTWADMISKSTPASRTNVQQLPEKTSRPVLSEQVLQNKVPEFVEPVDQPPRPSRAARNTTRSFPRDDEREGFGDRLDRRGGGSGRDSGTIRYADNQQIFVGNLPNDIEAADLREHFSEFGHVLEVKINHSTTMNPNFGFVIFKDPKSVEVVLQKKPTTFKNFYRINIEEKKQKNSRDGNRRMGEQRRSIGMGDIRGGRRGQVPPRRDRQGSREGPRSNYNNAIRR